MYLYAFEPINFNLVFGVFVSFVIILMLKDTVMSVLTFVKGINFN